jgi:hypothetical protein
MAQPPPSARGRRALARMGWEGGNPPRAHLGRAAPWNQALVLFPPREPPGMAGARASGMSFREACARGYLRPYAPHRGPDACPAALVEEAAKNAHENDRTPRDGPEAHAS